MPREQIIPVGPYLTPEEGAELLNQIDGLREQIGRLIQAGDEEHTALRAKLAELEAKLTPAPTPEPTPTPPPPAPPLGFTGEIIGHHFPSAPETGKPNGPRPSQAQAWAAGLSVMHIWWTTGVLADLRRAQAANGKVYLELGNSRLSLATLDSLIAPLRTTEGTALLRYVYAMATADEPDEHSTIQPSLLASLMARWYALLGPDAPPVTVPVTWAHTAGADRYLTPDVCRLVSHNPYRPASLAQEVREAVRKAAGRRVLSNLAIEPMPSQGYGQPTLDQVKAWIATARASGATDLGLYSANDGVNAPLWAAVPGLIRDLRAGV